MGLSRRLQADLSIIGLSAIWGCTFVVVKRALEDVSPLLFITIRFALAALPLWLLSSRAARGGPGTLSGAARGGVVTGALLFTGFLFQTVGIQYTTPARSAFITAMYVIFTPLLSIVLGLRSPSVHSFLGALMALSGLFLLTRPTEGGAGFGYGELLTLLCALAFSGHLLAVDHYTRRHDKSAIAFLQVAVVALLAIGPTILLEPVRFVPTPRLLVAVAITSIIGTAIAFYVLNLVQSWTTPTRAAIIFAAEPVFAAVTSRLVDGEVLGAAGIGGAAMILAGILLAEIRPGASRQAEPAA